MKIIILSKVAQPKSWDLRVKAFSSSALRCLCENAFDPSNFSILLSLLGKTELKHAFC